jgi:hypothetical protein
MGRHYANARSSFLILVLCMPLASVVGQSSIPNPILNVQDSAGDGAAQPLVQVQGGSTASTLGVVVTSQATGAVYTGNIFTTISGITGTGFGGLSLAQLGTSTTTGVSSPFLSLCAQQVFSSTPTPECWSFQVLGGASPNTQDILQLSHTSPQTNLTLQVPNALNFAAGDSAHGGQLTISGVPTISNPDLSKYPITIVGGFTGDNLSSTANAAVLQLFPGFLNNPSPNMAATALEGALQIGMAVKGYSSSNANLLACYTSAQMAAPCTGVASPLLGVYLGTFAGCPSNCSTGGSSPVITPPGRATVTSSSAGKWNAGTPVCRDPSTSHVGLALVESLTSIVPCPIGQAVGVAVGDGGSQTTHLVDLDFSDQVVGSHGASTQVQLSDGTGAVGNFAKFDASGNVTDSGVSATANQILNIQGNLSAVTGSSTLQDVFTYALPANTFTASAQEIDISWCTVHSGANAIFWQMTIGSIAHTLTPAGGSTGTANTCGTTKIATFGTFVATSAPTLIWTEAKSNFGNVWGGSQVQTTQTINATGTLQLHLQFSIVSGSTDTATPLVWVVRRVGF